MQVKIKQSGPVPVRASPDPVKGRVLGWLPGGAAIDLYNAIQNSNGKWVQVALAAGATSLLAESDRQALYGYIDYDQVFGQPGRPAVQAGLAVIANAEAAMSAAQAGCRFFSVIFNPELASRIKDRYPDAVVLVRPDLGDSHNQLPSADKVLERLRGATDSRLIYLGINEVDQVGQDANGIRARAALDIEVAQRIKAASGAVYAAGSFSVGTPDFTSPQVCDLIREVYAPHYNSGLLWWDNHLYSPDMQHIFRTDAQTPTWRGETQTVAETQWFEMRWRFLFTRCGFDPRSPSRVVCSETGVDDGGGFTAHNATGEQVVAWCKRFAEIAAQPLVVAGAQYESPFVGGAIFQAGDWNKWSRFNMTPYLDAMGAGVWAQTDELPPPIPIILPDP
jgi:hypothetical protein